jgi:GGDEF domain-containing protein
MSGPFRKTDAVLTITQNNARRSIEVTAANEAACKLVGHEAEALVGMEFSQLLPARIATMLSDYVEFGAEDTDVGDVLRKVSDFAIQPQGGKPKAVQVKVLRHTSLEHAEYLLIFHNEEQKQKTDAVMKSVRKTLEGKKAIHAETGLPHRESFGKAVETLLPKLDVITNGVCVAVCELDDYDAILAKHGIGLCHKLMHEAGGLCKLNLRGNDVVALFDERRLALMLVGAGREPAKIVLNRLRWLIGGMHVHERDVKLHSNATVWLHELTANTQVEDMLEHFERAIAAKTEAQANSVIEV